MRKVGLLLFTAVVATAVLFWRSSVMAAAQVAVATIAAVFLAVTSCSIAPPEPSIFEPIFSPQLGLSELTSESLVFRRFRDVVDDGVDVAVRTRAYRVEIEGAVDEIPFINGSDVILPGWCIEAYRRSDSITFVPYELGKRLQMARACHLLLSIEPSGEKRRNLVEDGHVRLGFCNIPVRRVRVTFTVTVSD